MATVVGATQASPDQRHSYTWPAKVFHWLTAVLVIATVPLGIYMSGLPLSPAKFELYKLHKTIGMAVLLLVALRIAYRLIQRPPALPSHLSLWERRAATAAHLGLYGLLIAQPVTGILHSNVANFPLVLLGGITVPAIVPPAPSLVDPLLRAHNVLGFAFAGLIVLHIGAALRHHFVLRDHVLLRMLPFGARLMRRSAAALPLLLPAALSAAEWEIDREASRIGFTASQFGSPVEGEFRDYEADIAFDPENPEGGSATVTINPASVDTKNAERDATIRSEAFFAVEEHPEAVFEAERFERTEDGYLVHGSLTLRGTAKPIAVPFDVEVTGDSATAQGEVTVNRDEFGIGQGQWSTFDVVGQEVTIVIDLTAERAG